MHDAYGPQQDGPGRVREHPGIPGPNPRPTGGSFDDLSTSVRRSSPHRVSGGLPWVRTDTGLPSHPKMLALLNDKSPKRYQAAASVTFAVCWSGEHGTDGHIPFTALPFIHATKATAALLVTYGFWEPVDDGWRIHNFAVRQELAVVTAAKKEAQRVGALMANCKRWHGDGCGCWQDRAAVRP